MNVYPSYPNPGQVIRNCRNKHSESKSCQVIDMVTMQVLVTPDPFTSLKPRWPVCGQVCVLYCGSLCAWLAQLGPGTHRGGHSGSLAAALASCVPPGSQATFLATVLSSAKWEYKIFLIGL